MKIYKKYNTLIKMMLIGACLVFSPALFAHNINLTLKNAPLRDVGWFYIKLGFEHIIPLGLDHILFVIALCLLNTKLKIILWQATAFTFAHSITLALSMKGIFTLPAEIVEPIIAMSILFVAIENLMFSELKVGRLMIVFLFGLIHGLGFASMLNEIGLPPNQFAWSVISFNIGVEFGQIAVITTFFGFIILPLKNKSYFKKWIIQPISMLIAMIALYWIAERIWF